jgi:hypothetical protein
MAEMKLIGIFHEKDNNYVERNIGFNSREVIYYAETNDPEIIVVILAKDKIKEVIYVKCSARSFYAIKSKAESEDVFNYSNN